MMSVIKLKRMFLLSVIGLTALAILATGCSRGYVSRGEAPAPISTATGAASLSPKNGLVQSNEGGSVTIDIKWLGRQGNYLAFKVSMDTHSVDLDEYDLKKLALLRDNSGEEYAPVGWDSAAGGHHRSGELLFAVDSLDSSQSIEIVLRNIAGVAERVFIWKFS